MRILLVFILGFMGASLASPAFADTVGEEYDNRIAGNVRNEGEPLGGVRIDVSGNGYAADVLTDADGKWQVGVPERGVYTVTIDVTT
jgi:branched-chain amino acid transport system permease protein